MTKDDNPRQFLVKRENSLLFSPKAATMQFTKLAGIERPTQNSSMLKLPIHESPQYFEDERLPKIKQFYTPQNRLITQNDPASSNNYSFSQRIAHLKLSNGGNGMHSPSYSKNYSGIPESPKLRSGMNNSMPNKPSELYRSHLLKDSKRNEENNNYEYQESRLARMNFIERQEQVIHKYRPKLHSDADIYAPIWSLNTNIIKYGTPKH